MLAAASPRRAGQLAHTAAAPAVEQHQVVPQQQPGNKGSSQLPQSFPKRQAGCPSSVGNRTHQTVSLLGAEGCRRGVHQQLLPSLKAMIPRAGTSCADWPRLGAPGINTPGRGRGGALCCQGVGVTAVAARFLAG
jgi:hypothetical protein